MSNGIVRMPEPPRHVSLRRCSFRFSGRPHSIKAARDWLSVRMDIAGVPEETADTAVLLLSELATNALVHTASGGEGGAFYVRAFFFHGRLRVEVRDAGRTPFPVEAATPDPDAENGRGLLLVDTLAHRWGRFESGRGPGMFFELRWNAQAIRTEPAPTAESFR
ncbi:anti-sigma regulatory factor (Ser/Thr protein kinase) [Spinactinospora alkalitolerans]|uniref:Anti-sigma regulatory factor (Ser/Thr protein kinase) n=1 Tax=Spinactinospora alkalitolerans TaxID=687207 RepID=A0A852U2Y8_9ACTN|nr:ATP-binding protein [Spinactinospora alkalitolerans]NYE48320.1 anti-sigma regulatory factor (Ser/Thr protein kinase) [Spinactinospora alkalitolerans]